MSRGDGKIDEMLFQSFRGGTLQTLNSGTRLFDILYLGVTLISDTDIGKMHGVAKLWHLSLANNGV